ncbi:MAG: hypothetical protein U9Q82_11250 [Chloroflexota bacterium]|nr:hypothetical protein [Chloroflexota bacterium]
MSDEDEAQKIDAEAAKNEAPNPLELAPGDAERPAPQKPPELPKPQEEPPAGPELAPGDAERPMPQKPPELPKPQEEPPAGPELAPGDAERPAPQKPPELPKPQEEPPDEPEPLGPQEGMSLKERYAAREAMGGDEADLPPLSRAAPGYQAGEYAQHPEPKVPEDAGRGPAMVPSQPDPFGLEGKAPPKAPEAPPPEAPPPHAPPPEAPAPVASVPVGGGIGSTDALADTVKAGNALLEKLVTSADELLAELTSAVDKLSSIEEALSDQDEKSGGWEA